jgi:excisionase family DNA binding protein
VSLNEEIAAIVRATMLDVLEQQAPSAEPSPLWTTEQTAQYLGVDPRTIANLRKRGFPFRRVGDVVRFDKAEVDAWTREQAGK